MVELFESIAFLNSVCNFCICKVCALLSAWSVQTVHNIGILLIIGWERGDYIKAVQTKV